MLAVRSDSETERRLDALAARTGRTKTFYAREAIAAHLDDLEAFYLTEERLRRFREALSPTAEATAGDGRDDLLESLRRLWVQGEASGAPNGSPPHGVAIEDTPPCACDLRRR